VQLRLRQLTSSQKSSLFSQPAAGTLAVVFGIKLWHALFLTTSTARHHCSSSKNRSMWPDVQ
jgi:hypothetical protein